MAHLTNPSFGTCPDCNGWVEPPRLVHQGACQARWNQVKADERTWLRPAMIVAEAIIAFILGAAIMLNWR